MTEAVFGTILEAALSFYHEYREYSYHLILDGFFTGLGCRVQSERERLREERPYHIGSGEKPVPDPGA